MLEPDPGPPPLFLPRRHGRPDPDRPLIDAAIAAGRVTVCPGFGEGEVAHWDARFDGMTLPEYLAAREGESRRKQAVDEHFRRAAGADEDKATGAERNRAGHPREQPRRPRIDNSARNRQIVEDYAAGMSPARVAEKHGLAQKTALNIVKRDAPEILRTSGGWSRQRDAGKGAEALALRSQGLSWPKIAEALGYASAKGAAKEAGRFAKRHSLPWPPRLNPR